MSKFLALSEQQQEALSKTKECTQLLDHGTEVPVDIALSFLESKTEATQRECANALGYQNDTKKMLDTLRAMVTPPVPPSPPSAVGSPEGSGVEQKDLPIAPTTTFNIIRLIQLGYIPLNKPEGKLGLVKWIFYGPNAWNLAGRAKTDTKMLDWAEIKSGVSFRTALEQDIAKVEKELLKYKDATSAHFDIKSNLEKQLQLLESIRNERDPKVVKGFMDDYIKARSAFNLTPGAVGYADPVARKTQAQLDAEVARAEARTQVSEDRISNLKKDLEAMNDKTKRDSTGNLRETLADINKRYDDIIQLAQKKIDAQIKKAQKEFTNKTQPYNNAKAAYEKIAGIVEGLQKARMTAPNVANIKPGANSPMTKSEIDAELAKLGKFDATGKIELATAGGAKLPLELAHEEFEAKEKEYKKAKEQLEKAKNKKTTSKDSLNESRKKSIDKFNAKKQWIDSQIQSSEQTLPKRQEAEVRITNLNNEIKRVQTELAVAGISPTKQAQLEGELRALYGQKNAATTALENAVNSGSKNTKNGTLDTQKTQIENEVAKLHQIDAELKPYKAQIDALHAEAKTAQEALRNERDPVKAKKLLDEMPAKVNGWNSQIGRANETARGILNRAGLNWKNIPEVELRSVLNGNPLLSNMIAHPDGFLSKVTAMEQTANGQKVMKFAYGGLRLVAVAGAARTITNDLTDDRLGTKAAVWDAVDAGMGFVGMVPVVGNIASGVWDIGWAAKQLATGTDINGRQVSTSQSFVRLGFGVVGLVPVVGNIVKGTKTIAHSAQAVRAIDATSSAANLTMKGAAVAQVGTLAYDVVDVTTNMVRNPVDTAIRVIKGQEQRGIVFENKKLPYQTVADIVPQKLSI